FLVDPTSRAITSAGPQVVARASRLLGDLVTGEFNTCQIEMRTPPHSTAARLHEDLVRARKAAASAAQQEGLRLCAAGMPIIGAGQITDIGDNPRYQASIERYRTMMEDFALSALHVHIQVPNKQEAALVANHLRPWLPLLVALTANSAIYDGRDTEYASWRSIIRSRFPCLGPPPYVDSMEHYEQLAAAMFASGAMPVEGLPFWDIRPHPRLPTLEIRSMDVPADVEDTVAVTVLIRALVTTSLNLVRRGVPGPRPCGELLRAAYWRAARDGWFGSGFDALTGRLLPTPAQAEGLVKHVRDALVNHGDLEIVTAFLDRLAVSGTGADQQRGAAQRGGPPAAVDELIALTASSSRELLHQTAQ
ncbi:MAG: YbdK family carboxylate-amine ligase, partial [Actinomycetota bacterium]|nr:YbdK family carboxylate-amine ligase [Actinomycetota bacterium]